MKTYRLMYPFLAIALFIAACAGNGAVQQQPSAPLPTPAPVSTPDLFGMTQVVVTVDSYVSLTTPENSEFVVEFHKISGSFCWVDVDETSHSIYGGAIATVVKDKFYIRCNADIGNTVELFVPQTWTVGFPVTR